MFGIDPRACRSLEQLHHGSNNVEDEDDAGLPERLQPKRKHRALHGDGEDRQCVIATDRRVWRPEVMGSQKCPQHERAEEARPSLLEHEHRKLEQHAAPAGQLRRLLKATPGGVEAAIARRVKVHP